LLDRPSTYYDGRGRQLPVRVLRDEQLKIEIVRAHAVNCGVTGRGGSGGVEQEGIEVARCTGERLMAELSLVGARRGRRVITTRLDPGAIRPADPVRRRVSPAAPNHLWVTDFTYCATCSGTVFVAFVIDAYARRVVGWRADTTCTPAWCSTRSSTPCGSGPAMV
jgi:putative transposase